MRAISWNPRSRAMNTAIEAASVTSHNAIQSANESLVMRPPTDTMATSGPSTGTVCATTSWPVVSADALFTIVMISR